MIIGWSEGEGLTRVATTFLRFFEGIDLMYEQSCKYTRDY